MKNTDEIINGLEYVCNNITDLELQLELNSLINMIKTEFDNQYKYKKSHDLLKELFETL